MSALADLDAAEEVVHRHVPHTPCGISAVIVNDESTSLSLTTLATGTLIDHPHA
jgi:hypothetical protein